MHDILITILLGLAVFKAVDLIEELVPGVTRFHALTTVALAIAGTMFFDYSVFSGLDIGLREAWMGPLATGLMVAGATSLWRGILHWMGSSEGDEPEVRHTSHLRSAA